MNDRPKIAGLDPISLLKAATEAVPATKWAVGVIGLAAAASIIVAVTKSAVVGVVGVAGVLVAMVALFLFSRLLAIAAVATRPAAVFLLWFVAVIFAATVTCIFTSAFFNAPWPLRDRLFTTAVAAQADAKGMKDVAEAARGLSSDALTKLVEMNDSNNIVTYNPPNSNVYEISPIPKAVRELEQQRMIVWSSSYNDFRAFALRFGLNVDNPGPEPQRVVIENPSPEVQQRFREFSYRLNERGLSLYRLIMKSVLDQIRD